MMITSRFYTFLYSVLFVMIFAFNTNAQLIINERLNGISQSDKVLYIEDVDESITLERLISGEDFNYKSFPYKEASIPFTNSTYWLNFTIKNELGKPSSIILEVARAITNEVEFFLVKNEQVILHNKCGDDVTFSERMISHRKNLLQFGMQTDEELQVFVRLKSDGELIFLPVKLYTPKQFYFEDGNNQLYQGFYFGILGVVVFIYFFFYQFLKDRTFLFYVLYVFSIFLLQFSLEGFSYQYFFPNSPYFANHIVLFSASITIAFVLYYSYLFLDLKKFQYKISKFFKALIILCIIVATLGLLPGPTYQYGYPLINVLGLISVITILVAVFFLISKGHKVSKFFTVAIVILVSGAVVFILADLHIIQNLFLGENALKISSGIEALVLSISMASKYRDLNIEKEKVQSDKIALIEEKNQLISEQKSVLEEEIKQQTKFLKIEQRLLEEKNKELTDSINYAKRLQNALIPPKEGLNDCFNESFVLFQPKDIVSGDFYWFNDVTTTNDSPEKMTIISVADCTGHGVPGAFMSIIGIKLFNESIKNKNVNSPAEALNFLNEQVFLTVNKHAQNELIRDGMDLSLIAVSENSKKLYYSGANNPIYIIPKDAKTLDDVIVLKADRFPIGSAIDNPSFTNKEYSYSEGDVVYLFTDGYADQFGGPRKKKLKYSKFKELLFSVKDLPMKEQHDILQEFYFGWKGDLNQIDDVCVLGIRL